MATWIIIAAIGVVIAIVIAAGIELRSRREREQRRLEAGEHREKAELQALRAREREEAAREELDRAERERAAAQAHAQRADEIDPDLEDESRSG